jgi:hypothetical protein
MSIKEQLTTRIEVLTIETTAIFKLIRTRRFRALQTTDGPAFSRRLEVYEDRYFELQEEINRLLASLGGSAQIWSGVV